MSLTSLLYKKLEETKWLTMEEYMEYALYHPTKGYYMNDNKKIGRNGDFYTSSFVSDVFATVWADFFVKKITHNNLDPVVVEFGGGNGHFAQQIQTAWNNNHTAPIKYIIVERSPFHRKLLEEALVDTSVTILSSFEELKQEYPSFRGIIFANEVLDAFPLRIFKSKKEGWYEKGVTLKSKDRELSFEYKKVENRSLLQTLDEIFESRNKQNELEVSFQMLQWLKELYEWTDNESCLYFVDYGLSGDEWNNAYLKEGSIRGYYRHQMQNDPLAYPGKMDITYHIDWEQVQKTGYQYRVETLEIMNQGDFLLKEGLLLLLQDTHNPDPFSYEHKRNRAIRSFLLDSTLANGFQVIQQQKKLTV
ncbi:SAM-dependent methyltransferase [Fictibacillus sp. b24]|uniref:SAM-dependent methyltransferase n=1 Tax=Fictibacillus sp. b24 TaxID=3055863 RepID=UPI0025A27E39|nr:SAM-dependent methyltransferase [Fictibacillus sp. b24]MDM5315920.1 SAM-dependent methyltransferase [Fictibacillus sp. b24]